MDEWQEVFTELAERGKSVTRLPKKSVDRDKILRAMDEAFELIGGVPRLAIWASNNPGLFYPLWVKAAPRHMSVDADHKISFIRPSIPAGPLDDFVEAEYVDERVVAEQVCSETAFPSLSREEATVFGDGMSSPSRENSSVR
jgi:hypothetical protein